LDKFIKGEITRLMIFCPPQHGKSELVSRRLPAFLLGKDPDTKVVVASYSSDLSTSFNRDCQRIIDSLEYHDVFPKTILNESNVVTTAGGYLRNSDIFQTVGYSGFFKAVGVGGALTGTTADIAIIDDPVKDSIEASSPTFQLRNWNWYNDVLFTRIHNKSKILITQTRWNINDLSGLLVQAKKDNRGDEWVILNLPAIKEVKDNPDDPREVGEALWESKHSLTKLMQVKKQSTRTFMSLYQGNPQPTQAGGEMFKQFQIHRQVTKVDYRPDLALHISFDFNVNPAMHATVSQLEMIGNNGRTTKRDRQICEIICSTPQNSTKYVCKEIVRLCMAWGHQSGMFIYGDPAGKHEDTRSEKGYNDFVIIMNELQQFKPVLRVLSKAPSVVMRCNFINTIFESNYEGIELTFDDKCAKTIEDYLYLKEDSDGTKLKEKEKDPATQVTSEKYGHLSDANEYKWIYMFEREYQQYMRGDKPMNIKTGRVFSKNAY
jgi:hypothetical protein